MYSKKTKDVKKWWNKNPFSYSDGEGTKYISESDQDLNFFEKVEKKFISHSPKSQNEGEPLLSNFFDYKNLANKKILDIACGTGLISVEFARQGCDVTAIDITPFAVACTKKNMSLRGLKAKVFEMDAQSMLFEDEAFNFVSAHGCLMHMPNMEAALNEIYRVLKKESSMYAWVYHKGWYYWFGIIILRGIIFGDLIKYKFNITKLTSRYTDGNSIGGNPHTIFHSKSELVKKFKKIGFKNISSYVVYNPLEFKSIPTRKLGFFNYLPEKFKKWISKYSGLGLVITAVK